MKIAGVDPTDPFKRDLSDAAPDTRKAALAAIDKLVLHPSANSLRLHALKGQGKPTVYKIDVLPNRSWQISFHLEGEVAILRRLATHKDIDRGA